MDGVIGTGVGITKAIFADVTGANLPTPKMNDDAQGAADRAEMTAHSAMGPRGWPKKSNKMKFLKYLTFLLGLPFLYACAIQQKLYKNVNATIIYGFEQVNVGDNQEDYFFKSASCLIGKNVYDIKSAKYLARAEWHDLLGDVNQSDEIFKKYITKLDKRHKVNSGKNRPALTKYFSKKTDKAGIQYSDHIYNYYLDESEIYIIFNILGDISLLKKISNSAIAEQNLRHYCPIQFDTLNLPLFKVIKLKEAYPTPKEWLTLNGYYKMPIDSFRINFCD